ncbi:hypothetical protein AAVH_34674 [Aphelenchoides avenae]|nr:hypothetical protein AAVH_34674 [Aphelenchus avenae]
MYNYHFSKTPLPSENFVDVFSLLGRWQLDPVDFTCRHFRYIVSTKMDTVCLREFESVRFVLLDEETISVFWRFTENSEKDELREEFSNMEEAMEDTKKRILSSAVEYIEFWGLKFTDETLAVSSSFSC